VIELHDHVRAEVPLDLHHELGRKESARAVEVALKLHAVLADRTELRQREHLESARVRENRTIPAHEAVQPAHLADDIVARAEVQVVGVGEYHRRAHSRELVRVEGLHRGERAHRHERRRLDGAVGSVKYPGACAAARAFHLERKTHCREANR
jgi:hypothetical protein